MPDDVCPCEVGTLAGPRQRLERCLGDLPRPESVPESQSGSPLTSLDEVTLFPIDDYSIPFQNEVELCLTS